MAKIKQQPEPNQQARKDDFKSVARRLERGDDKARFEAKLGKLAKATPNPAKKNG